MTYRPSRPAAPDGRDGTPTHLATTGHERPPRMSVSTAPKLREELEVITGMDDLPLIFDPVTGSYHRLSRSGRVLVGYLDGTRSTEDLVTLLAPTPEASERLRPQLDAFLTTLHDTGLLVASAPVSAPSRLRASRMMPRVVVSQSLPRLLEPLAAVLRRAPLPLLSWTALLAALVGFAAGAVALAQHGLPPRSQAAAAVAVAVLVQLVLVLVHECAHALVAQVQRVPVRGLGFAMLFWFMPVAYVDRTDAYRLRDRRGRLAIALAGMVSDGIGCGTTAVVLWCSDGFVEHVAVALIGFQLVALLVNLNPLLPGDGYTALETATGLVDFRGRAFSLVKALGSRQPLPVHLATLTRRARLGYVAYAIVAAAYVALAAVLVLLGTITTVEAAVARAGA